VRALIEQHAAAFTRPRGPPATAAVVRLGTEPVGDDPVHTTQFSELTALDQLPDLPIVEVGPLVEHRGEDLLLVAVGGDQALGVGAMDRDRLFDHDVQPGLQRLDAEGRMVVVRRGNQNGIDQTGGHHVIHLGEALDSGDTSEPGGIHIAHRREFELPDLSGLDVGRMCGPHVTETDDANAYLVHKTVSGLEGRRETSYTRQHGARGPPMNVNPGPDRGFRRLRGVSHPSEIRCLTLPAPAAGQAAGGFGGRGGRSLVGFVKERRINVRKVGEFLPFNRRVDEPFD
jgi:hypothetical protein